MNLRCPKILFSLLIFLSASVHGQNLTGIWKGYFITEGGEQYKLEFQIGQEPTFIVNGISYSYLDDRFYGKSTMKGKFSKLDKIFRIEELRTVEVKNASGGTCLMNYTLTYSKSGKEHFLEGTYLGKSENRRDPALNGKWGDCGNGRVFLRKVESSDFYVEPFLKEKPKQTPPVVKKDKAPVVTPPKKNTNNTQTPRVRTTPQTQNEPVANGGIRKKTGEITTNPQDVKVEIKKAPKIIPVPVQTRSRENQMVKTITVHNQEITIKLYDNGEVDNDTISVYLDDKPVVSNKRLSTAPVIVTLKLDESTPEHTLIMVAENLGRIPPNTSLMIILDGETRHTVNITSTEQKNAMVRFRYQKK